MAPTSAVLAVAAALLAAGPVRAQAWNSYTSEGDAFTVSIPGVPTVRNDVFTMADGSKYPSHVHTVRQGPVTYSVTVVDVSKGAIDGDAAIDLAARTFTRTGVVRLDVPSRTGNPPLNHRSFGREIDVVHRDRSESALQIFAVRKRLYVMEGKSLPPDAAEHSLETIRFVESISFPRTSADDAVGVDGLIPPAPAPDRPNSVAVKAPASALTERWRWAPGGAGKVEYCRQTGKGAETCAVADNPAQGDHMPASPTAPFISALLPGQAWIGIGGTAYFCKHTAYKKNSPMEVTCAHAVKGGLPALTPIMVQAIPNGAARFFLMPGYRSFFCQNTFPAPEGDPSQVFLMCQAL
ncbi:MAG TPA: hypothetical protein VL460_00465 [Caulobacteraceae bacterium]|jgi:hypothetical protein|nr:hypothetical protein [Caulobacteraceae bacterium]